MSSFFRKAGANIKKSFTKGGGDIKQSFNKLGGQVDLGLRKTANSVGDIGNVISKSGEIAKLIAPVASVVPVYGTAVSTGLNSYGNAASQVGRQIKNSKTLINDVREVIQKPKPEKQQDGEMIDLFH